MSSSADIETRILEMKLDNDEFEKGVRSTIKSLEDLEEKLELKDAGDGFDKVSKAANTVQFSNMERSLDAITDKFSLLGNVGLQALERISNKIVDVGEKILKGLTIDPVMDGWNEFEMKTNSIQTILGGTKKYYKSDQAAFKAIGQELDALNEYADQTIYSFAQMTENVGKFTNQNIELSRATKAIKGIGNWAALVGADSAQMSRAMYNISQSLGGGAMKLIDWKSIRLANMATPDVQKLFADIALAQGGLTDKKGNVLKKGSKAALKAYQTVISDFEGSLKTGWLTNDIMMKAFGVLSGDLKGADLLKIFGDTEEGRALAAEYQKMGEDARRAATQVKTLTQLIGVLKESLGSGWATSFEKLFGGFEKQRLFFTRIADLIGERIKQDADNRNSWIDRFTGNNQGTELLMDTIVTLIDLFTQLWGVAQEVSQALIEPFGGNYWFGDLASRDIFGGIENNLNDTGMTAQHFAGIVADLNYALHSLTDWFHGERTLDNGVIEKATPAYENAKKIFAGLGSVVMIALNAIENLLRFGGRILALFEPLASSILNLFGNVGGILYSIYQNIAGQHMFSDFFDNMYLVVGPVVDAIVEFLSLIVDLIASFFDLGNTIDETGAQAENNKLGPFIKLLSNVFEKLPLLLAPVAGFLTRIVKSMSGFVGGVIKGFPAIKKHVKKEGVTPFEDLKDIVKEFITAGFGEETAKSITDWYNNNVKGTLASMVEWFGNAYNSVMTFFSELPDKVTKLVERVKAAFNAFSNYNYNDALTPYENFKERIKQVILALFGEETGKNIIEQYRQHVAPYVNVVAKMIENSFAEVKRVLNGLIKVFQGDYTDVDNPFDLLNLIVQNFLSGYDEGNEDQEEVKKRSEAASEFFRSLNESYEKDIQPYVNKVLGWAENDIPKVWDKIDRFLFGYTDTTRKNTGDTRMQGDLKNNATKHVNGLIDNIEDVFETIMSWVKTDAPKLLDELGSFMKNIWDGVGRFLFGYDIQESDLYGSPEARALRQSGAKVGDHVNGVIDYLKAPFDAIKEWIQNDAPSLATEIGELLAHMWEEASKFLFGYNLEESDLYGSPEARARRQSGAKVGDHVNGLIDNLKAPFSNVLDWIQNDAPKLIDEIGGLMSTIWQKINRFLFGYDIQESDLYGSPEARSLRQSGAQVGDHVNGLYDTIIGWAKGEGTEAWTQIQDFLLGKEVIDEKTGKTTREGGAWQAVETFLDPIIDWIKEKGEYLYNYVTTHSFSEMWADLNELFLGHEIIGKQGNSWLEGGIFSEMLNTLKPISDFFSSVGSDVFEKIKSIDFSEVWQKIDEFFNGKDVQVLARDNTISNETFFETQHIEGVFERIVAFFDRIIGFFESETWQNIKNDLSEFYETYIHPFLTLFEGTGNTLLKAFNEWDPDKDLLGNLLTIASTTSGYFTTELPKIIEKMLPEGFSISGLLGDFFKSLTGGDKNPVEEAAQEAAKDQGESQNGFRDVLKVLNFLNPLNLFLPSSASAEEFDGVAEGIDKQAGAVEEVSDKIKETVENAQSKLTNVTDFFSSNRSDVGSMFGNVLQSIGGWFTSEDGGLGGVATAALMVFGLSKTSNIVGALTGNEKDRFIQDVADLFDALGGFLEKISWLLAVSTVSDLLSQADESEGKINAVDHIFKKITELLSYIFRWISGIALGSFVGEVAADVGTDIIGDEHKLNYMSDVASPADNIMALGTGLKSLFEGLEKLFTVIIEFLGINYLFEHIDESFFTENGVKLEKDGKKLTKFEATIDTAMGIVERVLKSVVGVLIASGVDSLLYNAGTGWLAGWIFKATSFGDQGGLKTRSDSFASSLMGVASFMESILAGISGLLVTVSLMSIFTDFEKVNKQLDLVERCVGFVSTLIYAVSGLLGSVAIKEIGNSLRGLSISQNADAFNLSTGGKETVSGALKTLGSVGKAVLWVGAFVGLLLVVADIALIIMEKNIQRAGNVVMTASAQVSAALDAIGKISIPQSINAALAFEVLKEIAGTLQDLGYYGMINKDEAEAFFHVASYVGTGFKSLNDGLQGMNPNTVLEAIKKMKEAWTLFKSTENENGFDVNDFQFKAYVLQMAARNIGMASEAFRGITEEDVTQMDVVKRYMTAFNEVASIMAIVNSLGDFGLSAVFGYGFQPFISFMTQLSDMGATVKKEGDNITGLEELDPEILRGAFTALIDSLPDPNTSRDLYDKLLAFTNAGGGNIGLFVNGLTGLNGALTDYQRILSNLNVADFTEQSKALERIDQLGKISDNDYTFLNGAEANSINTRLGLFANDIISLSGGLAKIGAASRDSDGKDYNLTAVADFVNQLYNVGAVGDGLTNVGATSSNFGEFSASFNLFSDSFSAFVKTMNDNEINPEDLTAISKFINDISTSEAMLFEAGIGANLLDKVFGASGELTIIANSLPGLGTGIHSLYDSVKQDFVDEDGKESNLINKVLDTTATFVARLARATTSINSVSSLSYSLKNLAEDLWNTDGTGLFNVLPGLFNYMAGDKINTEGMNATTAVLNSLGEFARRVSAFAYSEYTLSTFGAELSGAFSELIYPSIQSMPVSEIQAYASAFSDLSNAMTMNGQTATLAQAVDDALNALRDKEIEVRVTPVWNLPDNMPNGPIAPSWGFRPNITNDYSASTIQNIQFPAVQAVSLVPEDLSAITRSASDAGILVSDKVDDMNSALGGLRVQLDTGVLVGQLAPAINRYLGRNYQNPRYIIVTNPVAEEP